MAGSCSWHALQGGKKNHGKKTTNASGCSTVPITAEGSLDGRVEELDLPSESLRLLMQLSSLLLHLADVLGRLLQRGGLTDLSQQTRRQ